MAAASSPPPEASNPKTENTKSDKPEAPVSLDTSLPQPADPPASSTPPSATPSADPMASVPEPINPTPVSAPAAAATPAVPAAVAPPPHPVAPSFTPSFRPLAPQFSPVSSNPAFPNPAFTSQNPSVQPPGVTIPPPGAVSGSGTMAVSVSPVPPPGVYYHHATAQPPGVAPVPYWQPALNGYMAIPAPSSQAPGLIPPPGIPRYPAPYPGVARPVFHPRPPAVVGVVPTISRPPAPIGGAPIVPPLLRPVVPIVSPTEKPQTTVYVGKIASTVDNDFIKSLLGLCGPVKSWKRPSDGNGTPKGFGFCEFESAEGVLRALRLLSKLNVDGQELVLNVNQATREYLERYISKKTEREKLKETGDDAVGKEIGISDAEKQEPLQIASKKDAAEAEEKKKEDDSQNFGIVTDDDRNADKEALEKVKNMLEERLKTNPLPPPPISTHLDGSVKSNAELASKSKNGEADADGSKNAEDKIDDDVSSENKISSENDRAEGGSSDRPRRRGRSRERDREYEIKREKDRELERYERDRERERMRRERERDHKIREAERLYKDRLKEWEAREREKEYQRQYEKEREKERENKRRREISLQEDESDDDDSRKRRHRSSVLEEKRRRRSREKEDDFADRRREEEEIAEARKREVEEEKQKIDSKPSVPFINGTTESEMQIDILHSDAENAKDKDDSEPAGDSVTPMIIDNLGDPVPQNVDESITVVSAPEIKRNGSIASRKLGFGLVGSGKKTIVPSVFYQEDDEEANKDKKMRPLVPIDYSMEELQAVQRATSGTSPNLVAAAEFAKRISGGSIKDEKSVVDKDRRRTFDRHRDKVRNEDESKHAREDDKDQANERISDQRQREKDDKPKMTDNKKLLDAKQLIDMIPKTKEELFSYDINWAVYDKHELHERMRPWISKKVTEFLGEEEPTLVDYIVSNTNSHVPASEMLGLLDSILDEEAEMFVLKMWRMLIFEIKKVEKGLTSKLKA